MPTTPSPLCATLCLTLGLLSGAHCAAPNSPIPPGKNVHRVAEVETGVFWRGAAPLSETLTALASSAKGRKRSVTLLDLRSPANSDDRSRKGGRHSPESESAAAKALGIRYRAISALDKDLVKVINTALSSGDVYIHCMYGVNRTGFAVGRWARSKGSDDSRIDRTGLGDRDWRQGWEFQSVRERSQGRTGRTDAKSGKENLRSRRD